MKDEQQQAVRKKPLVSIIIATYNAEKFLGDCLDSISKQVIKNLEVIIVDGNSTDQTGDIVRSFNQLNIIYSSEQDAGIYDALNKGVKQSTGRWLYFLGADDRLLPGFSELAIKLKDPDTVYYGNSVEWYEGKDEPPFKLINGVFSNYKLAKYCMNHQSIFYPAATFEKYQYELKYKVLADYALNIKLWGDKGFKKIYYPINIVNYNLNGFSHKNKDEVFENEKPQLIKENFGFLTYLRFVYKTYRQNKSAHATM